MSFLHLEYLSIYLSIYVCIKRLQTWVSHETLSAVLSAGKVRTLPIFSFDREGKVHCYPSFLTLFLIAGACHRQDYRFIFLFFRFRVARATVYSIQNGCEALARAESG